VLLLEATGLNLDVYFIVGCVNGVAVHAYLMCITIVGYVVGVVVGRCILYNQ